MSDDAYSDQLAAKNRELSFKLGELRRERDAMEKRARAFAAGSEKLQAERDEYKKAAEHYTPVAEKLAREARYHQQELDTLLGKLREAQSELRSHKAAIEGLQDERDALAGENADLRMTHAQWKREYLEDLSKRLQGVLRKWL